MLIDGVFGLEQGISHQLAGMLVGEAVEDALPLLAAGDHAGQSQLGEMLGNGGRGLPDCLGDLPDGELAVSQRQDDAHPRRLSQHREDRHSEVDVLRGRRIDDRLICMHAQIIAYADTWVKGATRLQERPTVVADIPEVRRRENR